MESTQPVASQILTLFRTMTIAEQIRQIMLSEELSDAGKLDRLYAIIPPDACKIENLSQATPAQLKQLKDGLAITDAMQQLRRRISRTSSQKETELF
jgi:hypothetical protein